MATTTNYSWSTPDDTALVKDGAAAIRSLGTAIDTTVFTNAGAAIAKATVDAKGDLIAGTADNTVARLAVGANNTILVADSSTATGLKWAAPAGGGKVLQVVSATTTTQTEIATQTFTDSTLTATITPTLATSKILILVTQNLYFQGGGAADQALGQRIMRDSTEVWVRARSHTMSINVPSGTGPSLRSDISISYLDSPATTSAVTYKTQCAVDKLPSGGAMYAQLNSTMSSIILLEIGA